MDVVNTIARDFMRDLRRNDEKSFSIVKAALQEAYDAGKKNGEFPFDEKSEALMDLLKKKKRSRNILFISRIGLEMAYEAGERDAERSRKWIAR